MFSLLIYILPKKQLTKNISVCTINIEINFDYEINDWAHCDRYLYIILLMLKEVKFLLSDKALKYLGNFSSQWVHKINMRTILKCVISKVHQGLMIQILLSSKDVI